MMYAHSPDDALLAELRRVATLTDPVPPAAICEGRRRAPHPRRRPDPGRTAPAP